MKIIIDTKEDSSEEIRKVIRMLSALIGESTGYGEKSPPASGEGLFDMFGDPVASTSEQQQLGTGSGSGSQGTDINDFIGKSSSEENKSGDGDDDLKVVPY